MDQGRATCGARRTPPGLARSSRTTTASKAYAFYSGVPRSRSEMSSATAATLVRTFGASAMRRDRQEGGRLLAKELGRFRSERPIVLGVARGGVPVALEVAKALHAPLDVMTVQKVGADECPEYTIAAVAEGGPPHVRLESLQLVGVTEVDAAERAERAAAELLQRARAYRGDAPAPNLAGRTVLLIDDGVATGATACAAAKAARRRGAARVILAAPVIAAAAELELRHELDEVVALDWPRPFLAVGIWYECFDRVSEQNVVDCLRLAGAPLPQREADRIFGRACQPAAALAAEALEIPCEGSSLGFIESDLVRPAGAKGIVVFSTGSIRESPRYRLISRALHQAGLATLRCDLLTPTERRDQATRLPVDPKVLPHRIAGVIRWISTHPTTRGMHRGLYGAGAGAEGALVSVAGDPELVEAVVVRAGQLDTVSTLTLASIRAPVLLVVGSRDENVLSVNRAALSHFAIGDLAVVPGATDLFGEPGALEAVSRLAADWFKRWLERAAARGPARALDVPREAAAPSLGR
jgi:putative phosphoribosyl transferase